MKKPSILVEIHNKEIEKEQKTNLIMNVINGMVANDNFIDSVKTIKDQIWNPGFKVIKSQDIRRVLKEKMGMRYKKVVAVSMHANSEKNKVLR